MSARACHPWKQIGSSKEARHLDARELTVEHDAEAALIEVILMGPAGADVRRLARRSNRELIGQTECLVRDAMHRLTALAGAMPSCSRAIDRPFACRADRESVVQETSPRAIERITWASYCSC